MALSNEQREKGCYQHGEYPRLKKALKKSRNRKIRRESKDITNLNLCAIVIMDGAYEGQ